MKKKHNKDAAVSFDSVISVNRVTKVTKGGKRFSFSAFVISGDGNGSIGIALEKSKEASAAIAKALLKSKKNQIKVTLRDNTLPYDVVGKHGASIVVLKSASRGTGVIAGGPVRSVMEAVGVKDVLAKSIGSSNPQNIVKAALNGLAKLRSVEHIAKLRGLSIQEVIKGKDNVTIA